MNLTIEKTRSLPFAALILVTLAAVCYWEVPQFGFVWLDDYTHVIQNPAVHDGFSIHALAAAFNPHFGLWVPLTWISLMLDVSCFGLDPGAMHVANLLFHTGAGLLLFWWLKEVSGDFWKSLFVAALFMVHPLNAESVAWITERKNVLAQLFSFVTLLGYSRYTRNGSHKGYAIALAAACCAMLSKPSAVTLPFLLLLLDIWPHRRLGSTPVYKLLLEKAPFFLMTAVTCVMGVKAPSVAYGYLELPLSARIGNALTAPAVYLGQLFAPIDLAIPYLHPGKLLIWPAVFGTLLIAAISALAWIYRRRVPWLMIGWLWFLGNLVPSLGLVQVGLQSHADRFTYFPQAGIFIALAWTVCAVLSGRAALRTLAGALTVGMFALLCHLQAGVWRNSYTLAMHALDVFPDTPVVMESAERAQLDAGDIDGALETISRHLKADPNSGAAWEAAGSAWLKKGDHSKAAAYFQRALQLDPSRTEPYRQLAQIAKKRGDLSFAEKLLEQGLAQNPKDPGLLVAAARLRAERGSSATPTSLPESLNSTRR